MRHALVVGGTGMLARVSIWLVNQGYHVSIIARNPQRMDQVVNACKDHTCISRLLVDYQNAEQLSSQLKRTIKQNGPIDLVVAWIHSEGEYALKVISQEISLKSHSWQLFHVLGSRANMNEIKESVTLPDQCLYRQVQLGFIVDKDHSRWLTNDEISSGIIDAIANDSLEKVVGTLTPWEKRP